MKQRLSLDGYLEILSHEAIVTSRYKDSVGVWTIGVGHTKTAGGVNPQYVKGELTLEQCLDIFIEDVAKFERRVNDRVKNASQQEFDAAVSFDFNTGGIGRASWVKLFNAGDKDGAVKSIMKWCKPREIIPRREKERDLLRNGKYSHDGHVTVYPATPAGDVQWKKGKRTYIKDVLRRRLQGKPIPPPPDVPKPETPAPAQPKPQAKSGLAAFVAIVVAAGVALFVAIKNGFFN